MTGESDLSAIILEGGRSRRFGRDKADEVVDGRSLLQHVSPLASEVIVVAAPGDAFRPIDSALPLKQVEDVREGGALGGLTAASLPRATPSHAPSPAICRSAVWPYRVICMIWLPTSGTS